MRIRLLLLSLSVAVGVLAGAGVANANTIYPQTAPTFVGPVRHRLRERLLAVDRAVHRGLDCVCLIVEQCGGSTARRDCVVRFARDAWANNREPRAGVIGLRGGPGGHRRSTHAVIPTVRCQPLSAACDSISTSAGGATGVEGLNAVDSASLATNPHGDIEPPDQGLCAGNGSVVETNNIGEILVYNTALQRQSAPIPLDTVMGLTAGDIAAAATRRASMTPATEAIGSSPRSSRRIPRPLAARSPGASPAWPTSAPRGSP